MEYLVSFSEWLQANPGISGLVFVLAVASILAVGIPGGNVLLVSSGLLFGALLGGLLALTGVMLAAFATYAVVRTAFGKWLDSRAQGSRNRVRHFVQSGNFLLLVVPRLIPVIPFFALNVGLIAAGVPKKSYLLSTFLGLLPMVFIMSSIGARLGDVRELSGMSLTKMLLMPGLYVPLALLILITLSGWLWVRNHPEA
jgi:uncharacterized membrane protein YdjX (TVP38/TMEM64 family)